MAEKLQAIWRGHKMAHITTPAGTDLYMEMNQMEPSIECGIAEKSGRCNGLDLTARFP